MEVWWIGAFAAVVVYLLWVIARNTEKAADEAARTRHLLTSALYTEGSENWSDVQRIRSAIEHHLRMEAEKRPPLGPAIG